MVNSIKTSQRMSLVRIFLEKSELEEDDANTRINRGKNI